MISKRRSTMKRICGFSALALLVTLALGAAPAFADETAAPAAAPTTATAQQGCGQTPDLATLLSAKAQISPAVLPLNPAPDLKVGRTCRCSCGQPCKKDADCGPGGLCVGGISCC
jgi:hypothetical protein